MNCRQNDIAIIARNVSGIRCIGLMRDKIVQVERVDGADFFGGLYWRLRQPFACPCGSGRTVGYVYDADLTPIRDVPGDDQTIGWVEDNARAANRDGVSA